MECLAACPGLAIFMVDKSYSKEFASVSFPFEYRPLPLQGDSVQAVNRAGEYSCDANVIRVMTPTKFDCTTIVTIEVPIEYVDDARCIKRLNADTTPVMPETGFDYSEGLSDDVIVCRCEEITVREIRKAIRENGADSVKSVKNITRAGMGLCQGKVYIFGN